MEISENIKRWGRELGFSMVRFARAEELIEEGDRLGNWLRQGRQGSMEWLVNSLDRRVSPSALVPGAKSVIVTAIDYFHAAPEKPAGKLKIARFAWGDDYHEVIRTKLEALWGLIAAEYPRRKVRIEVDSGPVMEKAWAKKSGIGWQGKHSIILNRQYGSWFLIGVMITDLELDYDSPVEDLCGDCTLCVDSCPTNAITEPYVIDARKCISYQTVENMGAPVQEFAGKMEDWIFGCDICQEACPWNDRRSGYASEPLFAPREYSAGLESEEIMRMTENEFSARFRNSPVKRRKLEGLKNNVKNLCNIK